MNLKFDTDDSVYTVNYYYYWHVFTGLLCVY